jgi:AcrR family transcriptional regulator
MRPEPFALIVRNAWNGEDARMERADREGNLGPEPQAERPREEATGPPTKVGRPRDARAHQAIVDATLDLLASQGYARLTIEAIAARAGVGKTTIYRRWSSKGSLVIEAISGLLHLGPTVDTGDTRADLAAFLKAVVAALATPLVGGTIPGLTNDMAVDPGVAGPFRGFLVDPERARLKTILDRAEARGELAPGTDREMLLDMLVGPVLWRALITGRTLDAGVAERIVDKVVRGFGLRPADGPLPVT